MTDQIVDAPTPVTAALSPETFDVMSWLNDTQYATKVVEVFNKGEYLQQLAELEDFIATQHDIAEKRKVNATLIRSITDEAPDDHEALIAEAQASVDAIIESMRGTGIKIHLRGIAPGEREVIEKRVARAIKPKPAKYEEIEGERVLVEEAVPGGRQSPQWAKDFQNELAAASVVKIESASGAVQEGRLTAEALQEFGDKLHRTEFNRIANAAYDVNFFSYDIDKKVTLDF